ncbi:hypothetical protein USB125703_00532 [Pseudoclavibacter triregionum]|nr:hypothetical protein USB125703_00532 [Pseudoclavibacter triregionum]
MSAQPPGGGGSPQPQPPYGQQPQAPAPSWPAQQGQAPQFGQAPQQPVPPAAPQTPPSGPRTDLADGEWHRLHWATPLLKGGIVVFAIVAWLAGTFLDSFLQSAFGAAAGDNAREDVIAPLIIGAVLALSVVATIIWSWLSWRVESFMVGRDVIELRTGLLARRHRQIRLDRIQGVNVGKNVLGMIVGAARLEFDAAGEDANVALAYLREKVAEALRAEVLRRASGARAAARPGAGSAAPGYAGPGDPALADPSSYAPGRPGEPDVVGALAPRPGASPGAPAQPARPASFEDFLRDRVNAVTGPELDPELAAKSSVIDVSFGRMLAAQLLSAALAALSIGAFIGIGLGVLWLAFQGDPEFVESWPFILIAFGASAVPAALAFIGSGVTRAQQMARFTIAGTPDGLRIGRGLVSTLNDTLPPGRIHALEVRQPLLWRPFGWWEVRITRAARAKSSGEGAEQQALRAQNVLLPVGKVDDVRRVLALALPMHDGPELSQAIERAMLGRRGEPDDRFASADHAAAILHPFVVKRVGWRLVGRALVIRAGILTRRAVIVPAERIQSVRQGRGIVDRMRGTATVSAQVVAGPVAAELRFVADEDASRIQDLLLDAAIAAAADDTSHRWAEAAARSAVASARMQAADAERTGGPLDARTRAILEAEREWDAMPARQSAPASAQAPWPGGPGARAPQPPHPSPQQPSAHQPAQRPEAGPR